MGGSHGRRPLELATRKSPRPTSATIPTRPRNISGCRRLLSTGAALLPSGCSGVLVTDGLLVGVGVDEPGEPVTRDASTGVLARHCRLLAMSCSVPISQSGTAAVTRKLPCPSALDRKST